MFRRDPLVAQRALLARPGEREEWSSFKTRKQGEKKAFSRFFKMMTAER